MDTCVYCKQYHPDHEVCDEYIERVAEGATPMTKHSEDFIAWRDKKHVQYLKFEYDQNEFDYAVNATAEYFNAEIEEKEAYADRCTLELAGAMVSNAKLKAEIAELCEVREAADVMIDKNQAQAETIAELIEDLRIQKAIAVSLQKTIPEGR